MRIAQTGIPRGAFSRDGSRSCQWIRPELVRPLRPLLEEKDETEVDVVDRDHQQEPMPRRPLQIMQPLDGDADSGPDPGHGHAHLWKNEQGRLSENGEKPECHNARDDRHIVEKNVP